MRQSTLIRVGLSAKEMDEVRKISERTGVTIARLTADAVRKHLLGKKAAK